MGVALLQQVMSPAAPSATPHRSSWTVVRGRDRNLEEYLEEAGYKSNSSEHRKHSYVKF